MGLFSRFGKAKRREEGLRRAAESGDAEANFQLGLFLHERGNADGAETAFRRASELGHAVGAYNLGLLLDQRGGGKEAEAAFRRADELGSADGALMVAGGLTDAGDLEGAEAALRRAEERGSVEATFLIGMLLRTRDLGAAEAAFRRASDHGHIQAARQLGDLLFERGDREGAEDAWIQASPRKLFTSMEEAEAFETDMVAGQKALASIDSREAELRAADASGSAAAAYKLGWLLYERDTDVDGAMTCYRRANERGDPRAPAALRHLADRVRLMGK